MKTILHIRGHAFSLIELLVVIAIIAVLVALLLPVVSDRGRQPRVKQADVDMYNLSAAISEYDSTYSRLPGVTNLDTTFGYSGSPLPNTVKTNSDVMVILLDEEIGVNLNHARNPQHRNFFQAKQNSGTTRPGISIVDWQFRDPWGNPFIITLDLDYDGKCYDAFYRKQSVSQTAVGSPLGLNGLQGDKTDPNSDNFGVKCDVMIWSLGPDGKADPTVPANVGVNKDNVLGWQ